MTCRDLDDPRTASLERLLDLAGEADARGIVAELGRPAALADLDRLIVRRQALRMLQASAPRTVIRDRLIALGLSERTAYRAIEAALRVRFGRNSATEGPDVAGEGDRLAAPQPPTNEIDTMDAKDIAARLAQLQAQRDKFDVPKAEAELAAAEKAFAEFKANVPNGGRTIEQQERYGQLATAERAARARLQDVKRDHQLLTRDVERFAAMAHAEERIAAATGAKAQAGREVAEATAAVESARAAVSRIGEMIQAEQQAFDMARGNAASALLATVKAGGDVSTVKTPNLDRVATLELAKLEAEHEHKDASARLTEAQARWSEASRQLLRAQAGATDMRHEIALAGYVEALAAHSIAHYRAFREGFPVPNLHERIEPLVRRALD